MTTVYSDTLKYVPGTEIGEGMDIKSNIPNLSGMSLEQVRELPTSVLAKALGLPEDASEEDVAKALDIGEQDLDPRNQC